MGYSEQLFKFIEQSRTDSQITRHYDRSYNDLEVKVSFGQGGLSRIPWVSFLKAPNTTSKGIYPVYLLYKNIGKLVLAYGISETNLPNQTWNLTNPQSIKAYFRDNNLGRPARYGSSYVFKAYDVGNMPNGDQLDGDLDQITSDYLANTSSSQHRITDAIEIANFIKNIGAEGLRTSPANSHGNDIYNSQIKPRIEAYKNNWGVTPNIYLKSILDKVVEENNFDVEKYKTQSFRFHGQTINCYEWACIYLEDGESRAYSRSLQLFITIDYQKINFGLFMGDSVMENDPLIVKVKQDQELLDEIFSSVNSHPKLKYFKRSRPRARDTEVILDINSLDSLRNGWSNSIYIKDESSKEDLLSMPSQDNYNEIIFDTLNYCVPIFKKICEKINSANIVQGETMDIVPELISDLFLSEEEFKGYLDLLKSEKNVILQGPPGVGKTYIAKKLSHCLLNSLDNERIEMIQFHQSYSYEDFMQGYRPDGQGGFECMNGIFYKLCEKARIDSGNDYVLIIDEINRGNLSKIFGELLMLIEADKRGEGYEVSLTYSPEEKFSVPENLFIIGTMNTADRSIAMVDYALRRRFSFISLAPQFNEKFSEELLRNGFSTEMIQNIIRKIDKLNSTIREDINLGEGFQVGHSYFCPDNNTPYDNSWYEKKIKYKVEPLLKEYWFDDPEMVQSLLEDL